MAATVQVEFIAVNPGIAIGVNDNARRRIRVQVMKDFRRKEREQKASAGQSEDVLSYGMQSRITGQLHSTEAQSD